MRRVTRQPAYKRKGDQKKDERLKGGKKGKEVRQTSLRHQNRCINRWLISFKSQNVSRIGSGQLQWTESSLVQCSVLFYYSVRSRSATRQNKWPRDVGGITFENWPNRRLWKSKKESQYAANIIEYVVTPNIALALSLFPGSQCHTRLFKRKHYYIVPKYIYQLTVWHCCGN